MNRGRGRLELEPGQQRLSLRMIGETANRNREGRVWEVFDHIAHFHNVLALTSRIQPERRDVVNVVEPNEGIVERLCDLVAVCGYLNQQLSQYPDATVRPRLLRRCASSCTNWQIPCGAWVFGRREFVRAGRGVPIIPRRPAPRAIGSRVSMIPACKERGRRTLIHGGEKFFFLTSSFIQR